MPKCLQEYFLIGCLSQTQPDNFPKCPVWKENETEEEKQYRLDWNWEISHKRHKVVYKNIRKEFKKTSGNIWHHLSSCVPNNEVISRHGAWIKTSIKVWELAVKKAILKDRYHTGTKTINNTKFAGSISKDHYEVFFDEKI